MANRYIQLQEEYIKDEQRYVSRIISLDERRLLTTFRHYRSLKRELVRAQEEIKRIQSVPLVIGQFMEAIDQKYEFDSLDNKPRDCLTNPFIVRALCKARPVRITSSVSCPRSTARSSSPHHRSPYTGTPTHLSISFPPRPIPPLRCSVRMRSPM